MTRVKVLVEVTLKLHDKQDYADDKYDGMIELVTQEALQDDLTYIGKDLVEDDLFSEMEGMMLEFKRWEVVGLKYKGEDNS